LQEKKGRQENILYIQQKSNEVNKWSCEKLLLENLKKLHFFKNPKTNPGGIFGHYRGVRQWLDRYLVPGA
jgi:hypothetical protein